MRGVGVLVPVFGDAPYLAEALDSALGQEPPPTEVVVVDNASARPLRLEDRHATRCTLVRREVNGGPAGARATGLEHSGAPLIALLDCDDLWEPGKLAAQLAALKREPQAGLCFGAATVIGPDGTPTGERLAEVAPGLHDPATLAPSLFHRNPIPTSSTLIRREAIERAGGLDHAATDDLGLWLRLARADVGFLFEPAARVRYRRHPGGVTADLRAGARMALAALDAHGDLLNPSARARARRDWLALLARGEFKARRYAAGRAARAPRAPESPPWLAAAPSP
ncbi:MAG: glycosyltransferase family 2 protein [Thermoleophilaceae bacterium]